jgi:hypothetical protein
VNVNGEHLESLSSLRSDTPSPFTAIIPGAAFKVQTPLHFLWSNHLLQTPT